MDYMKFVNYHRETNADITIGCIAYGSDRAKEFGLMKIDDKRRVMVRACALLCAPIRACLSREQVACVAVSMAWFHGILVFSV
jgi:hypothetical protein